MSLVRLGMLLSLLLSSALARAELWGYVDGAGVAHLAGHAVDSNYALILGEPRAGNGRVPGKTDGATGMLTWLEIAPAAKAVQPWLREASRQHGVDIELLTAVIAVESGFDPKVVSPRGAMGLMQITAETAERYATKAEALRPAEQRLLDPRTNIHTGARMLADLNRRFGRIDAALAAWNAGEGRVRQHGGRVPPIPETQAHVHMVLELYWALLQRSQTRHATRLSLQ
nr:lytic transglycosylase domain-containing protein [uncultured Roseateles sp.]